MASEVSGDRLKKVSILVVLTCVVSMSKAYAATTSTAVPIRIDVDRNGGMVVCGNFGNPNNCTIGGRFYVSKSPSQYSETHSIVFLPPQNFTFPASEQRIRSNHPRVVALRRCKRKLNCSMMP